MTLRHLVGTRMGQRVKKFMPTAVVVAIVVTAATAAFAVAETRRFPRAEEIPVVVASQEPWSVATGTVDATAPVPIAAPVVPLSSKTAEQAAETPESPGDANSSTSSKASSDEADEPEREVITKKLRDSVDDGDDDDSDDESSDKDGDDEESTVKTQVTAPDAAASVNKEAASKKNSSKGSGDIR